MASSSVPRPHVPDPTAPSASAVAKAKQKAKGLSGGVVATVAGQPITLATYQTAYSAQIKALNSGTIPLDPPHFTRCVAASSALMKKLQAKIPRKSKSHLPPPSQAQLLKQCQARYAGVKTSVMSQLIQKQWTLDQARADGVSVSNAVVNAAEARAVKAMGGSAAYAKYLTRVGETKQQAITALRMSLIEQAVQQKRLGAPVQVTQAQVAAFFKAHRAEFVLPNQRHPKLSTYAARIRLLLEEQARSQRAATATAAYEKHWRSVTVCAAAYVVPLCANASS